MICLPPFVVFSFFAHDPPYTLPISGTIVDVTQIESQPHPVKFNLTIKRGNKTIQLDLLATSTIDLEAGDALSAEFNGLACLKTPERAQP